MKISNFHTAFRQRLDHWHFNLTAEGRQIGIAYIIKDQQHDVRALGLRAAAWRTPWGQGRDQRGKDVLIIFGECSIRSYQLFYRCILSLFEFLTAIEKILEGLFATTLTYLSGDFWFNLVQDLLNQH